MLSDIKALMFSGIVEEKRPILSSKLRDEVIEIQIERPPSFEDIHIGDSIAVNGICLTLEAFDEKAMQFAIGLETKKVTSFHLKSESLEGKNCNLERSLRLSDRIHGYLMSGHVEAVGEVLAVERLGENITMKISLPEPLLPFVWKKGGLCIEGVSLTINDVKANEVSVGLIPETLKRTNLEELKKGDLVNLEADYLAKALHRFWELKNAEG